MKVKIRTMLADAYYRLGIKPVRDIEERVQTAFAYMEKDREHYIEVVGRDVPEYRITVQNGVICKLIPIARETVREQRKDHIWEQELIFSLMVTKKTVEYVYGVFRRNLYDDPDMNSYCYPVYRYAELEDIRPSLQLLDPEQIRPVSAARDWEIFTMMFAVFDRLGRNQYINCIPHKTERAMLAVKHGQPEKLTVEGRAIKGKVIPLAESDLLEELREDHRYSGSDVLCLLITDQDSRYLLKHRRTITYLRKIIHDDVPGGCSYEPIEEKQEITYQFVELTDIRQDMHALYY